eukprot:Polyplicarium_translucidae@DN2036_c0_g1_i2.p1
MVCLAMAPQLLTKFVHYRRETKSQSARDDPAFLVLLVGFLAATGLSLGLSLGLGKGRMLAVVVAPVGWFFLSGMVIAPCCFWLLKRSCEFPRESDALEHGYCFDVHANASFAFMLLAFAGTVLALPAAVDEGWGGVITANLLVGFGSAMYWTITCYGYGALPFAAARAEMFLYPVVLVVLSVFVCVVFKVNLVVLILQPLLP